MAITPAMPWVNAVAGANAKGDSTELARMLDGVYRYIWTGNDISLDEMMNAAEEAAQWVYDHRVDTPDAFRA